MQFSASAVALILGMMVLLGLLVGYASGVGQRAHKPIPEAPTGNPSMDSLDPKGRFNCPCHGSIYDRYGDIIAGPAPRPMDLFGVAIRDGVVYIDTNPTRAKQRTSTTVTSDPTPV